MSDVVDFFVTKGTSEECIRVANDELISHHSHVINTTYQFEKKLNLLTKKILVVAWKSITPHHGLNKKYTDCPAEVNEIIAGKRRACKLRQRNFTTEWKKP